MHSTEPLGTRFRPPTARTTAACLLWGQGLAVLALAGVLLPSAVAGPTAGAGRSGFVGALVLTAAAGAAALLVGTGLRRSLRGARTAGVGVQVVLLAAALQSHRPVLIALVAAVTVVTGTALLSPALAAADTTPPDSTRAPSD